MTPTDAEAAAEEFVNKYGLYGQMSNPPLKTAAESFLIGFAAGLEKGRAEGGKCIVEWCIQEGEAFMPRYPYTRFIEAIKREFGEEIDL